MFKITRAGWVINNRNFYLPVLKPGNPRSGCRHGWVKALLHIADFLCLHTVEEARELRGVSLSFFFLFLYIYRERERGKEREREGEKHQCVVSSCMPPTGDSAFNPGTCPDWESNWQPFVSQACAQSTELHYPRSMFLFLIDFRERKGERNIDFVVPLIYAFLGCFFCVP